MKLRNGTIIRESAGQYVIQRAGVHPLVLTTSEAKAVAAELLAQLGPHDMNDEIRVCARGELFDSLGQCEECEEPNTDGRICACGRRYAREIAS